MRLLTEATQSKSWVQAQDKFGLDFDLLLVVRPGMIMMSNNKIIGARKIVFMKHFFDNNE